MTFENSRLIENCEYYQLERSEVQILTVMWKQKYLTNVKEKFLG